MSDPKPVASDQPVDDIRLYDVVYDSRRDVFTVQGLHDALAEIEDREGNRRTVALSTLRLAQHAD